MRNHNILFLLIVLGFSSCTKTKKTYYPNGQLKEELPFKNNKENGMEKSYFQDGHLQYKINIVNGLREGKAIAFYDNGNKRWEGTYKNDSLEGYYVSYHEDGSKDWDAIYINGKKNGLLRHYYENGKLIKDASIFKDDFQDGLTKSYYKNGQLESIGNYPNGKLNGLVKFYYSNGKLKMDAIIENDSTLYYSDYDSLTGKTTEIYRCVKTVSQSRSPYFVDEPYKVKLYLEGPQDYTSMKVEGGYYKVDWSKLVYFNSLKVKQFHPLSVNNDTIIYSITPRSVGKYFLQVKFITKEKNDSIINLYFSRLLVVSKKLQLNFQQTSEINRQEKKLKP